MNGKRASSGTTGGGGEKMGETWTTLGFADFEHYEATGEIAVTAGAKINFGSKWATTMVDAILGADPSASEYARLAQRGGDWDVKKNSPGGVGFGSLLYGKYASARDAGNFAAGAVAQNSYWPSFMLGYGFGLYNSSGNNLNRSVMNIGRDLMAPSMIQTAINILGRGGLGESRLSQHGINAGKAYMMNVLSRRSPLEAYFKGM